MPFFQTPPVLDNQYSSDRVLRAYLERTLPADMMKEIEPALLDLGELAGGELYRDLVAGRLDEPKLTQWDPWGKRIDQIEHTPLWQKAQRLAAERGIVATAYERKHAEHSRVHQFALAYLFDGSTGVYTCPLAMTDGAARTLVAAKNKALMDRAMPRLMSRDPDQAWTSGQWMTERTGGSDVGISEAVSRVVNGEHRLYGTKFFTSAATSQMALTLARPEGNPPGGRGLALYYVEIRNADGSMNGITVNRLKDKLGTKMLPTAELELEGTLATPVMELANGVKNITPMLTITRTWNSLCATSGMRRGLALAQDFSKKRVAFGAPLAEKPLHADTMAGICAEYEGAFLLAFRAVELLGKVETGVQTEQEAQLMRLLTPITKLVTGKQAVVVSSEVLEVFGGQGYMEDTGLPRLLREAQVLPIWEGTTNVLSLDVLRVLGRGGSLDPIEREIRARVKTAPDAGCKAAAETALSAFAHAKAWVGRAADRGPAALEAGARRFALTLGRALELALLIDQGAWSLRVKKDGRTAAAARWFARSGVDLILDEVDAADARLLAGG